MNHESSAIDTFWSLMARWHFAWLIHSFISWMTSTITVLIHLFQGAYCLLPPTNSEWVAYIPSHHQMMEKLKLKLQSPVVILPSCLPLIDGPFHHLRCMVELWRGLWLYYWLYCSEIFHTNTKTCQSEIWMQVSLKFCRFGVDGYANVFWPLSKAF